MDIDLTALLDVTRELDLITGDLSVGIPAPGSTGVPAVDAALQRVHAAVSAARLSRVADLTDLTDGMSRIRALWITTENALAAVPR